VSAVAPDLRLAADDFAARVVAWQRAHGRHDLPWQSGRDPYPIWVSEIMLQQTQVAAVIPYFQRFMARFPDVIALANAPLDDVLAHWSGLGYYARARNLHRAAGEVLTRFEATVPVRCADLQTLPGIGRSTAAAIAAFASGERVAILDGNVKRVLTRYFAIEGFPGNVAVESTLWRLAESLMPERDIERYTQGLMDLGATVCARSHPRCVDCPLVTGCAARYQQRVAEFPAPRPRRARPERQATLWLLRDASRILLQRRPPSGIWGGLWSLPEVLPRGVPSTAAGLPAFRLRHGFTHFVLEITVEQRHLARASNSPSAAVALSLSAGENSQLRWVELREALALGLPAPIRLLLDQLAAGPSTWSDAPEPA
jgi:A/G-specific adenine glycosylase